MPTAVIVGASARREKFGNKSVRAHLQAGYWVIPVNPRGGEIEGCAAVQSLDEVSSPETVDRISLYLGPAQVSELIPTLEKFPQAIIWFNPGTYNDEVLQAAEQANLQTIVGCSIVDLGVSPVDFPD